MKSSAKHKTYNTSIDNLIKACSKHSTVSIELSILVDLLLNIFNKVHDSNCKKIGILCSRNVITKLSTLVRIANLYLYKSAPSDYIADCKEISEVIKHIRNIILCNLANYSFCFNENKYYKYEILQKIESEIKIAYTSVEDIINKKIRIQTAKKNSVNHELPNLIDDYFTKTYPSDKEFIYSFIDENF